MEGAGQTLAEGAGQTLAVAAGSQAYWSWDLGSQENRREGHLGQPCLYVTDGTAMIFKICL